MVLFIIPFMMWYALLLFYLLLGVETGRGPNFHRLFFWIFKFWPITNFYVHTYVGIQRYLSTFHFWRESVPEQQIIVLLDLLSFMIDLSRPHNHYLNSERLTIQSISAYVMLTPSPGFPQDPDAIIAGQFQ